MAAIESSMTAKRPTEMSIGGPNGWSCADQPKTSARAKAIDDASESSTIGSHFPSLPFPGSSTGRSIRVGITWPSFQLANEITSCAFPRPAPSGTRTGP
jgi:hypothetical protein